ncbi:ABC transporter substrate-binding protein [Cohnella phaseoli]|uniref:Carbohydrate ABC transporter substrate-binding protein (CUT1 family) n=1 Tax=Cohnella phaseoli TaxID=456490 RepID=A0A3D9JM72_9BACL|nr:extracellular solute-binding protein [Cohnella phaseoli]RED75090.1 carbohydrate ABC transporter substrate-binding protein (CUT1 family) [Cohnella phaseoli]
MKKRKIERVGLTVLSGMLAASLAACSSGNSTGAEKVDKSENGKKVITISVLKADGFLKAAEQAYEQAHADIDVQIKEYAAVPESGNGGMSLAMDPADVEKYVNTVGTEVLSGKGADIISLSELPYDKYVKKEALVDLSELMAKDDSFDNNSYYGNIMDALKKDDGLYVIPLEFSLSMMIGDQTAIQKAGKVDIDDSNWTWAEFTEIASQLVKDDDGDGKPDKYAITSFDPQSFLVNLLKDQYSKYVDSANRKSDFDSKAFRGLLEQVKSMYDAGIISAENATWGEQFFSPWMANSPEDLVLYSKAAYGEGGKVYRKPGKSKGIAFTARNLLGINANSKMQQEAWNFMRFLLSEEMQTSPEFKGFPMNKGVAEKALDLVQENIKEAKTQLINGYVPDPLSDEQLQDLKELVGKADTFAQMDSKVVMIVIEEATSYFAGQKSAEEIGKLIQNRVTTYLNE